LSVRNKVTRKERIRNVTIRQQTGLQETIIKEIEQKQLTLYGHVQRMTEGRLHKISLELCGW
jgi:adenylate kinase